MKLTKRDDQKLMSISKIATQAPELADKLAKQSVFDDNDLSGILSQAITRAQSNGQNSDWVMTYNVIIDSKFER